MFHEHSDREGVENGLPPGMYTIPKSCEYCGAESTDQCTESCQRPKSFFRKQRPPFSPPGPQWDSKTDYEIVVEEEEDEKNESTASAKSWMSGLFAGVGRRRNRNASG